MPRLTRSLVVLLAGVIVVVGPATAVVAAGVQPRLPAIVREAMRPDVLRRDVRFLARELELDASQVGLVDAFVSIYHDAFDQQRVDDWVEGARPERPGTADLEATGERMRAELRALLRRDGGAADQEEVARRLAEIKQAWREAVPIPDEASVQAEQEREDRFSADLAARLDAWNGRKARLLSQFLADVPLVLQPAQLERWPAVERRFRRERSLARGRLSGERVDLGELLDDLELAPDAAAAIDPLVTAYEIELDEALRRRDAAIDRTRVATLRDHAAGRPEAAAGYADEQTTARVVVRDVNDRHAVLIAERLPADAAERFRAAHLRRAYPRAFRPTPAERSLAMAVRRPDLVGDPDREDIESMIADLQRELEPLAAELVAAIRASEEAAYRRRGGGGGDADGRAELDRVREQQLAISRRYEANLRAWRAAQR